MKNKGFTLIELLAIIVILAIIAVITVPIILNIIEKAKEGTAYDSAYGIVNTAKKSYFKLEGQELNTKSFVCEFPNCDKMAYNGEEPTSGAIRVSNTGVVNGQVTFYDKYNYCISDNEVLRGTCEDTVIKEIKEEVVQSGTHDLTPNKIYDCVQFDIEVKSGTTLPFCLMSETTDTVTLISKDSIGNYGTQWGNTGDTNNWYGPVGVFEKLLEGTSDWTNIPVMTGYSYDDTASEVGNEGYTGVTITNGVASITKKDMTVATVGDSTNQLRARTITKAEAQALTDTTIPEWLQGVWTISSRRTSANAAWIVKRKTLSYPAEFTTWTISDSMNVKAVITLNKSALPTT